MFTFLLAAITVFIPAHARYPDEILHKYFGDEDLWDTVTQKCINDRQWDHYFMCAYGAENNPLLTSDSDAQSLSENGNEYYSSAGTGTAGYTLSFTFPPDYAMNVGTKKTNPWSSPYGDDLKKYSDPNVGSIPLHVAHVIPKDLLRRFYSDVYTNFGLDTRTMEAIFQPLFATIYAKLNVLDDQLKTYYGSRGEQNVAALKKYLDRDSSWSGDTTAQNKATKLFSLLYMWSPGNLAYAPRIRWDDPVRLYPGMMVIDTHLQRILDPSPTRFDALKKAFDAMNTFINARYKTPAAASAALNLYVQAGWDYDEIQPFDINEWYLTQGMWSTTQYQ